MIGIENPNTLAVKAIYCHWDGYLEHNGYILQTQYDSVKADKLVAMGDLSSLGADIGEAHDFGHTMSEDMYVDIGSNVSCSKDCTFYGRDRGEDAPHNVFEDAEEAVEFYQGWGCEYFYLFRYDADQQTGQWFYKKGPAGAWKRLATALSKVKEEALAE
jgi:hypothetical protein